MLSGRYQALARAVTSTWRNSRRDKPYRILEVGTWDGRHAADMILAALAAGRTHVEYRGFDLFEDAEDPVLRGQELHVKAGVTEAEARSMILQRTVGEVGRRGARLDVLLFRGNTRDTLPQAARTRGMPPADVVFIDGGHSLETIRSDWDSVARFLHGRSVVLLDDYYPDRTDCGCRVLVEELAVNETLTVTLLEPVESYPELDPATDRPTGRTLHIQMVQVQPAPAGVNGEWQYREAHAPAAAPELAVAPESQQPPVLYGTFGPVEPVHPSERGLWPDDEVKDDNPEPLPKLDDTDRLREEVD